MHSSHELGSVHKIFINSGSVTLAFLTKLHNFLLLGRLNCLCNLVAILIFFFYVFLEEISSIKSMCLNLHLSGRGLVIGM